ncbi:MAG: TIR domain-containing protein, partial [bacterium]|nr:TIR domain-containing protein [bacterium]
THRDNKPLSNGQKEDEGWVSRFHHCLNVQLGEYLGRDPVIWRDFKLQGNDRFDKEIISKLQKAKILLAVTSPGYLNSEWCMKELREFLNAAENGSGPDVNNKSRIFKIAKTYLPYEEYPNEIRNLLGYGFFQLDEKKRPHEFMAKEGFPHYFEFLEKLKDVAWDIRELLGTIDKERETGKEQPPPPTEKTVYLAETASDLYDERENIRRDLKQKGYTILPDRHLPYQLKGGSFRDHVCEYLKQCKLSIHLVGNRYGLIPEGEERSVIDLQNQLASEQCKNNQLSRLIWIPPGLEKSEKENRQKEYITDLQNEAPQDNKTELLKTTLEDFKTVIQDTLEKINKPMKVGPAPTDLPLVYLVYDKKDSGNAKIVGNCLFDENLEVRHPLSNGSAAQYREMNTEYLRLCDTMMIYYDCGNEYWLQTKLNDIRKAPGYGREKPMKASIFITGEETEHKKNLRTHDADVIKDYDPCFCEALKTIVKQVRE